MRIVKVLIILFLVCSFSDSFAQSITIHGTVIDSATGAPMQRVSVYQKESGQGAMTDKDGNYSFRIWKTGDIHFSYIGYKDQVRAVTFFSGDLQINAVMPVLSFNTKELQVTAAKMNKLDSINNREENKAIFRPVKKSPFRSQMNVDDNFRTGLVVSPFEAYKKMFSKHAKRKKAYRATLVGKEQDDYINSRFNASVVNRITKLQTPALDTFMLKYRPSYDLLVQTSDYELYDYIKRSGQAFKGASDTPPNNRDKKKKRKSHKQ